MLKIVKTSCAIAITTLTICTSVHADINDALQNICTIIKADDNNELRKQMKRVKSDFNLRLNDYYSSITCGGNSLIRTAMKNNAVKTGTLLVNKMPISDLSEPEQDGKTVIAWATENGLDSSPIVAVLINRM